MTATLILLHTVILAFLLIAAVYDLLGGEIPIHLFPMLFGLFFGLSFITGDFSFLSSTLGLILGAFLFWIMARFFDGGGGDIIMMSVLGWCLGLRPFVRLVFVSSALYFVFSICLLAVGAIRRKRLKELIKEQYPYAPFVLAGYLICLFAGLYR